MTAENRSNLRLVLPEEPISCEGSEVTVYQIKGDTDLVMRLAALTLLFEVDTQTAFKRALADLSLLAEDTSVKPKDFKTYQATLLTILAENAAYFSESQRDILAAVSTRILDSQTFER